MILAASDVMGLGILGVAFVWKLLGGVLDSPRLLPPTKSTIDGLEYRVMPTANAVDAANQLSRVRQAVDRVLAELKSIRSHPFNVADGVRHLLQKHPNASSVRLIELDPRDAEQTIAYNEGKSTQIYLCMRQNPPTDQLGPDDVLLYIVLHELAHSMIPGFAPMTSDGHTVHDQNFRDHNEYLNFIASSLGLIRPSNVPGQPHCGVIMPDPAESP